MIALDIETAVRTWLLQQVEVTEHVSQRIYPDTAPEGTSQPWMATTEVEGVDNATIGGTSSLSQMRLLVEVVADTVKQARNIREQVVATMRNIQRQRIGDVFVNGCELATRSADYQTPNAGDDDGRYVREAEFLVSYSAWPGA